MKWLVLLGVLTLLLASGCRAAEEEEEMEGEEDLPGTVDVDHGASREALRTDDEVVEREEEAIKLDGLSVAEMKELRESAEKYVFQAEVNRMMKLIINSLYRNKEIFLRELISNASDALDKIRFLSLTDKSALAATDELSIKIRVDREAGMLHITDTGIGMTHDDLEKNLGTIAKSGTTEFFDKLQDVADTNIASDLIGQFGVGFYSSFLVADTVIVTSKHNDDNQYIWESDASSFSIVKDPRGASLQRGTTISLILKEEAREFLEPNKLRNLIVKYSQFINFPIYIWWEKLEFEEVPIEEDEEGGEGEDGVSEGGEEEGEDEEATVSDEEEKPKTKQVEKTVWDWDLVNDTKPMWLRSAKEVSDEEYNKFYEVFSKKAETPIAKTHFTAEGEVTFKSILFVPPVAPPDLISSYGKKGHQIKLYVRRVFITDDFEDILPNYLSFVCGVVDSDDLPLNVSREMLQQHKLLKVIKKKLVRKVLDMLKKLDKDDYDKFWKEFGTSMKLGVMEDSSNKTRLSKLLRFYSSNDSEGLTSLQEYVERMKETQEHIYYVAGSSRQEVEASPFVERLHLKGYEVLYLVDAVDEYVIQNIPDFEGKKLQNVAKEGLEFGDEGEQAKETQEELSKSFEPLTDWLKKEALPDRIDKAVVSNRLSNSPCAIVANQFGWSGNMERIMRAQAHYVSGKDPSVDFYHKQPKTLEVNPRHPLIRELLRKVEAEETDKTTVDLAEVLFETALLRSGYSLPDSPGFAGRIERMLRLSMGVDLDAEVEQEDFSQSTEEYDEMEDEEEEVEEEGEEGEEEPTMPSETVQAQPVPEDDEEPPHDEL